MNWDFISVYLSLSSFFLDFYSQLGASRRSRTVRRPFACYLIGICNWMILGDAHPRPGMSCRRFADKFAVLSTTLDDASGCTFDGIAYPRNGVSLQKLYFPPSTSVKPFSKIQLQIIILKYKSSNFG